LQHAGNRLRRGDDDRQIHRLSDCFKIRITPDSKYIVAVWIDRKNGRPKWPVEQIL
jgi:hypothetical protein